jgi:glutamate synthase (ferredoxin)
MVELYPLDDPDEIALVNAMVRKHEQYTASEVARRVLESWDENVTKFVKVLPNDYKRVIEVQAKMLAEGMSQEEAEMAAFEANARNIARVGGR